MGMANLKFQNLADLVSVSAEKTADTGIDTESWPIQPIPMDRYIVKNSVFVAYRCSFADLPTGLELLTK